MPDKVANEWLMRPRGAYVMGRNMFGPWLDRQARTRRGRIGALRPWLDERADTGWISSVPAEIESFRALAGYAPEAVARLPDVLDQTDLAGLDPPARILPQAVRPATVRSLDAIHLGTALHTRHALTSFVPCDKRLLDAALEAGLPAEAPA